jgi:hypothetical protein
MNNIQDRKTINNYLGNRGLATLDNPGGLCQQLGYLVEDETHLKQILNRCAPELRRECYEAVLPHLRFKARPLDVYLSELGAEAEAEQLPVVNEAGKFRAYNPPDIRTVQRVVEESISSWHLTLTCKKCLREETFHGGRRADVIFKARDAGWTYEAANGGRETCPACP